MAEELALDLEELSQLKTIAKRSRDLNLISSEIRNLEESLQLSKESASGLSASSPPPISTSVKPITPKPITPALNYIYVSLEGVNEDKVETQFKQMSFDVKIDDLHGKNYRCAIPKLNKEIVPEKCKLVVKLKGVIVTLLNCSNGNWQDIHCKEDRLKPNLDKERDPTAGIMDLMEDENMYEDGDEDMKRTIAKAWSDARSGRTTHSLKGV